MPGEPAGYGYPGDVTDPASGLPAAAPAWDAGPAAGEAGPLATGGPLSDEGTL